MSEPVPAGKGMPRAEMVRVALPYAEGLRLGSFVKANTPFAPEAYRVENGVKYAGEGCANADCGMRTQKIMLHPDIKTSVAAVDEEEGIVLLWMNFGDTHSYGPDNALVTFEAFKMWDGDIHAMNAFLRICRRKRSAGGRPRSRARSPGRPRRARRSPRELLCYNRPGSHSWPVLGAGFKPVVRYFVSRVGSTPTGFRHCDSQMLVHPLFHRARSVMYTPPKMTRPETTSASVTCSWRMRIPKTMASNGCRYEKAARREASMRASA